ncbi:MAG: carboxypeptidase-like regulatory domain-containing protein, partial [Bacteroidota bacterium]|nr:carboxypeptidase-like regulatory domain-containing protein [Bacteroidota bacterium]
MCNYKILKRVSFILTLLFISNFLLAQSISVSGTISDEYNEGMPGVNIKEINGKATSTTNLEGFYKIQVQGDTSKLEFSFIGYKKQVVLVGGRNNIDVNLKVMSEALDEVVVVGYGKSSIKELTGATVQVKGENVERLNIPRMDQALQGQVSGVTINT